MKYRKKPVVVEAFQLNERGLVGEDWFWDAVSNNTVITHDFGKYNASPAWCEINTLEGTMVARTGDYIIRGLRGELYPCKPDIFEKTYEVLDDDNSCLLYTSIINPSRNVKKTLEKDGYPFKSKEFSHVLAIYQRSGMQKTVIRYLNDERSKYKCPNTLRYM